MHIGGLNLNILFRPVKDKSAYGLRLPYPNRRSFFQIRNDDFPVGIGIENAVRLADGFSGSVRDFKLYAGKRLVRRAFDIFFNDQR